ncbi:hypothetical protein H4R34_003555 [Dimargaris verticillata]|uniref:SH3 domain-containing protein n=1 Tax=Dimargaris verticillata TaxID=2761393 RepID=A0A9W8B211_9FUNG|nr:hypothetical protein H4R34_003555 [Dimargaris verticillata]
MVTPALRLAVALALAAVGPSSLLWANAANATASAKTPPPIDTATTGQLAITGQFNGISSLSSESVQGFLDSKTSSVVYINGTGLTVLGHAVEGGKIHTACSLDTDGQTTIFIGGEFTSFGKVQSRNIVAYDPVSKDVQAMGRGLDGAVTTLYCDAQRDIVFVGGRFSGPFRPLGFTNAPPTQSFGPGAIMWSGDKWHPVPFRGLNGVVNAIVASEDNSVIYFGGKFTESKDDESTLAPGTQPLNLQTATITSGNDYLFQPFANPRNAICTSSLNAKQSPWLLRDKMPGFWSIGFKRSVRPALLRIKNTNKDGRGTKGFRLESVPDYTPVPLKYLDPGTGQTKTCDQLCFMADDGSNWQEYVVQSNSSVSGLRIVIEEWYGDGAGLQQVQVYERDITASLLDEVNPQCNSVKYEPSVSVKGSWTQQTVGSASVIQATFDTDDLVTDRNTLEFTPYVTEAGYYEAVARMPGCQQLNDCNMRTSVDFHLHLNSDDDTHVVTVSQIQLSDDDVTLYTGFIPAVSSKFKPRVTMTLAQHPVYQSGQSSIKIVAPTIVLRKVQSLNNLGGVLALQPQGDSVDSLQKDTLAYGRLKQPLASGSEVMAVLPLGNSQVMLGGSFSDKASGAQNVVLYDKGQLVALSNDGLNGAVTSMALVGSNDIYMGGRFTDVPANSGSSSLMHAARYSLKERNFFTVGGGFDDDVEAVAVSYRKQSEVVYFSGSFTKVLKDRDTVKADATAEGVAAWLPGSRSWGATPFLKGNIEMMSGRPYLTEDELNHLKATNGTLADLFFAGPFTAAASTSVPGIIGMNKHYELAPLIGSAQLHTDSSHGNVSLALSGAFVHAGMYFTPTSNMDGPPQLVIAGRFQGDDEAVRNIAVLDQDDLSPLGDGVDGEVRVLALANSKLFIGGIPFEPATSGESASGNFHGFTVWDFKNEEYVANIPALAGSANGDTSAIVSPAYQAKVLGTTSPVYVRQIEPIPGTQLVVVGGLFASAGGLTSSPNVCQWDYENNQWQPMGSGLPGVVNTLSIFGENRFVLAGGDLVVGKDSTYLAAYSRDQGTWIGFPHADTLPGPVLALVMINPNATTTTASDSAKASDSVKLLAEAVTGITFYLTGTVEDTTESYLYLWNGRQFQPAMESGPDFSKSLIQSLTLVPLNATDTSRYSSTLSSRSRRSQATRFVRSSAEPSPTKEQSLHRRQAASASASESRSASPSATNDADSVSTKDLDSSSSTNTTYGLLVSGALAWSQYGQLSTALLDVQSDNWWPLLRAIQSDGKVGSVGSVFYLLPDSVVENRSYLSVALVVIISIAISLLLVFIVVLIGLAYIYWRNKRRTAAAINATAAAASGSAPRGSESDYDFHNNTGKFEPWTADPAKQEAELAAGALAGLGVRGFGNNGRDSGAAFVDEPVLTTPPGGEPKSTAATFNSNKRSSASPYHYYQDSNPSMHQANGSNPATAEGAGSHRPLSIGSVLSGFEVNGFLSEPKRQSSGQTSSQSQTSNGLAPPPVRTMPHSPPVVQTSAGIANFDDRELFHRAPSSPEPVSPIDMTQLDPGRTSSGSRVTSSATAAAVAAAAALDDGTYAVPQVNATRSNDKKRSYQLDSPTLPFDQQILASPGIAASQLPSTHLPTVPDHTESSRMAARTSVETAKLVNMAPDRRSNIRSSLKDHPVYYAKFPFTAREHGELEFSAGERIFVIDNSDDIWWMGLIDRGDDRPVLQGVFPASYVSEQPPESSEAWRYI